MNEVIFKVLDGTRKYINDNVGQRALGDKGRESETHDFLLPFDDLGLLG